MATGNALSGLAAGLANGSLRIVDLTMPLGPETPVLPLSPPFPNSPMIAVTENPALRRGRPGLVLELVPHRMHTLRRWSN